MLETVATLFTTVFVVALVRWMFGVQSTQRAVPSVFCSWLTSTAWFARYGCDYLAWATSQYSGGDFSVTLMFRTYTFLGTPESVRAFTRAPPTVLALQPAVEQFTEKNFGLPAMLWEDGEAKPAGILRKILSPNIVKDLQKQLCITQLQLHEQYFSAPTSGESKIDIAAIIPRWTMHASLITLFGKPFVDAVDSVRLGLDNFLSHFDHFDRLFEAAASPLPGFLFPQFHTARTFLLGELRKGLDDSSFSGTIAASVIQHCGLPSNVHANVLLALLWAGLANVSATSFWAISFLLLPCHQHWRAAVEQQITSACHAHNQQNVCTANNPDMEPAGDSSVGVGGDKPVAEGLIAAALGEGEKSFIMGCVHEALRLRAQGTRRWLLGAGIVLRKAVAPLQLSTASSTSAQSNINSGMHEQHTRHKERTTVVPVGSLVAISPYQLHHDPHFFTEPDVFDPSRHCAASRCPATPLHTEQSIAATTQPLGCCATASKDAGDKQEAGGLRVAFGAGLFRCPGRSLALVQACLSIAIFCACTDACLCGAASRSAGCVGGASSSESCTLEASTASLVGKRVPRWLQGLPGGHVVARGVRSGDPHLQLPRFDARQLVGVKKPIDPLYAVCTRKDI